MKLTIAILACLLLTPIASAEPLSWFWRTDNYRVPLPQSHLAGYALIVERVNIHFCRALYRWPAGTGVL